MKTIPEEEFLNRFRSFDKRIDAWGGRPFTARKGINPLSRCNLVVESEGICTLGGKLGKKQRCGSKSMTMRLLRSTRQRLRGFILGAKDDSRTHVAVATH